MPNRFAAVSVSGLSRYQTEELIGSDKVISFLGDNRGGTANVFSSSDVVLHPGLFVFCRIMTFSIE